MSGTRRIASALAVVLAGLALVVAAPGAGASYGSPSANDDDDDALDTTSRESVADAWEDRMEPTLDVAADWSGSVKHCRAGKPSAQAQDATVTALDFAREMAGLDDIALSASLSRKAQKAALIMTANGALDHHPPKSWKCWSRVGATAAGRSNLAWTSDEMTSGSAVEMYLTDAGADNRAAPHRRWVLNPFATEVGNGLTDSMNALYVMGPTDESATNPDWVSWPSAGWFPSQLEPAGRWSLSSGSQSADFSHAKVVVKQGGTDAHRQAPATKGRLRPAHARVPGEGVGPHRDLRRPRPPHQGRGESPAQLPGPALHPVTHGRPGTQTSRADGDVDAA